MEPVTESRAVPFASLDPAAIARALAQIADGEDDLADVLFERSEEIRLPPENQDDDGVPGMLCRREEGLAVRLVRERHSWLAARDGIQPRLFSSALRQVARAMPAAPYPEPPLPVTPWQNAPSAPELAEFGPRLQRALRGRHVAFSARTEVARHRRWLQVVGVRLVPAAQEESFYSYSVTMPWGRMGGLLPSLGDDAVEKVAALLVGSFRSREAPSPEAGRTTVVLAPAAAAVLLHEAVAHTLEADTLAASGHPAAAIGVRLAAPGLHVLDDPAAAPEGAERQTDDEGVAVSRRWLLRDGVVEQPLADEAWARRYEALLPGAGRRSSRHDLPGPRSTFLEVLPGEDSLESLQAADDGLFLETAERGTLDPLTGRFSLTVPFARRLRLGAVAEPLAGCTLTGNVSDLLGSISGIGEEASLAGAGWCAKGGQRLPVWAKTPPLRLDGVEVEPR